MAETKHSVPDLVTESEDIDEDDMLSCKLTASGFDPYKALERSQSEATLMERRSLDSDSVTETSINKRKEHKISECSKVYFDLSKGETFEEQNMLFASSRSSSGRFLETIHQDEELQVDETSLNYRSQRSVSVGSMSSTESINSRPHPFSDSNNLQHMLEFYLGMIKKQIPRLFSDDQKEKIASSNELNTLIEQAWAMPAIGRDVAYSLSDSLRAEKALDVIISNFSSSSRELKLSSARLLDQVLTTRNREYLVTHGLEAVIETCVSSKEDREIAQSMTGILESLLKTSEEICSRVIHLGGLDVILYWCRCSERLTLRHCAIALANLALYGAPDIHTDMIKHKVPEWLFPLAFNKDDSVRYYACLAISVLVANRHDKKTEEAIINSGTLELVLPFISSHTPAEFARMDLWHRHGRSKDWLTRLVPVLLSKREEPQALAAFHFAMEAGIKSEQGRKQIFHEIDAIDPLKKVASSSFNATASKFAAEALKILGEEVPHRLSQQVPLWSVEDVLHWVSQIGFANYMHHFRHCRVDGDMLLHMNNEDLVESIKITSCLLRKRFMRELKDLKMSADYTSCDPSKLEHWLKDIAPEFSQYTYNLVQSGLDQMFLRHVNEEHLREDCGIQNGIHRARILQKIREESMQNVCSQSNEDIPDGATNVVSRTIDCFISYRRINGAQLASLLKVHLQLRGLSVFLDIERLSAGKFDESLLTSIAQSKNFILVLTPTALDRCLGDADKKDWVHREVAAALQCGCNIIPLTDNFEWPSPDSLPEDMRQICVFNGIKWIHDYQDACVDKLERFIRGDKRGQLYGLGSSLEDSTAEGNCKIKRGHVLEMGSSFEKTVE
ncbi:hypothetical protein CHS0354_007628 [Potamilus streckersoni]|uniref:ADP-ribosyl cyclase/cyclic ADP-ribose hydrolase n=1 Tax=Potamilus streckersoni TaxID=2493646 RepID=A0AAE0T3U8_9BIVA|nr:hypothetical protein CHS0354_007628 [Potamilus streckersoni]